MMSRMRLGWLAIPLLLFPANGVVARPLETQIASYQGAIADGEPVQVVYQEVGGLDKILGVTIPTSFGDVVGTASYSGATFAGYSFNLQGAAETYGVSIAGAGSGSWFATIAYGSAGTLRFTADPSAGRLQLTSGTADCAAINRSDLSRAMDEARISISDIATRLNANWRGRLHMQTAQSWLELAAAPLATGGCEPYTANLLGGGACKEQASFEACAKCCVDTHKVAPILCFFVPGWGPAVCYLVIMHDDDLCNKDCEKTYQGGAKKGEGCGNGQKSGTCENICIGGQIIPGNCAPPLICCHKK